MLSHLCELFRNVVKWRERKMRKSHHTFIEKDLLKSYASIYTIYYVYTHAQTLTIHTIYVDDDDGTYISLR